jgi:beta-lactamase regulating signal transducer with metallopeptidase domain
MSDWLPAVATWLVQTLAIGGSLLLLATILIAIVRQPSRRRMIGAVAVRIALLVPLLVLGPKWLRIPVVEAAPASDAPPVKQTVVAESKVTPAIEEPAPQPIFVNPHKGTSYTFIIPGNDHAPAAARSNQSIVTPPAEKTNSVASIPDPVVPPSSPYHWWQFAAGIYAIAAGVFVVRSLFAQLALRRLLYRSRPASESLTAIMESIAESERVRPQLRIVPDLSAPVCYGLWRPVVLLPQRLAEASDEESLRWVFAHELAHLRQGDAWTALWFGLATALYFPMPWFWWLKSRVSLFQEFVADAQAAAQSRAEEYAAFLVNLSRLVCPARPMAGVSGVLGSPSELYRRITMLLDKSGRVEGSCPRRWSLIATGTFLSMAVLLSGLGITRTIAKASSNETPGQDAAKDEPKKDEAKPNKPKKDDEEKFVRPQRPQLGGPQMPFPDIQGFNNEEFQKAIERWTQALQQQLQQGGINGAMGFPNFGNSPFANRRMGSSRLGVMVEKPSAVLVEQLDLPKDQGLVLHEIVPDSAAAKAGLKANDILLEFSGKPVLSDPQSFHKQVLDVATNKSVDAVVLRKGKREVIKGVTLPEAKAEEGDHLGGFGGFGNNPFGGIQFPNFPQIPGQRFQFGPMNGFNFGHAGAGAGASMSVSISNDAFSINSQEAQLNIAINGKIDDGKTSVTSVKITDGSDKYEVDSLSRVPSKYKSKVEDLLKHVQISK